MKVPTKQTVYLAFTILLGGLVWFCLHTAALLAVAPEAPMGFWPSASRAAAVLIGAALGLPVGRTWWRIVYEEKRGGLVLKIR